MNLNRREFIYKTFYTGVLFSVSLGVFYSYENKPVLDIPPILKRRGIIRPPGALNEKEFIARCIRCQRCSEACEPKTIKLFGGGYGKLKGTPYIIPEEKGCTMCLRCTTNCPTGALRKLTKITEVNIGDAVVDKRLCVSHNGSGICGACFTVCPLRGKAITQEVFNRPVVHKEYCTGCGMCEENCIVKGDKAIRVISQRQWSVV